MVSKASLRSEYIGFGHLLSPGILETLAPLDREFTPYYWLTVQAVDRGSVPLSAITEVYIEVMDINDNIPCMPRPVFYPSVQEDAPLGTSVLQLEAWDPDASSQGKLTFNLTSGNHMGYFVIHPFTGEAWQAGGTEIYKSTKWFLECPWGIIRITCRQVGSSNSQAPP